MEQHEYMYTYILSMMKSYMAILNPINIIATYTYVFHNGYVATQLNLLSEDSYKK